MFCGNRMKIGKISKRGQIAQTMNWTVATIVIFVFIAIFFLFILALSNKGVAKGIFANGNDFSGFSNAEREMMYLILQEKVSFDGGETRILELIEGANMVGLKLNDQGVSASEGVEKVLSEFSDKGVKCGFFVTQGESKRVFDSILRVSFVEQGNPEDGFEMNIGEGRAELKCE